MSDNQNQALSTGSSKTTTQPSKMITDLWGAMIALFGVRWSSQFGEVPDKSGQWTQTLLGISRQQVADALNDIRNSGRPWPPTAPEFRAMCMNAGQEKYPPMEACYSELVKYLSANRKDRHNLTPILYHTIARNMDLYLFQKIERDYDRVKAFDIAFKATISQLDRGETLLQPPAPETLLESDSDINRVTPELIKKTAGIRSGILSMFDDKPEPKLTDADKADLQRLERLK